MDVLENLAAVRTRWQDIGRDEVSPVVRVGLLASYTIDPLMPYAGVALHDAGLPVSFTTAPYNQIVRQCLDDTSAMSLARPDVLVVAPRFEELGDELQTAVDAAMSAARRWKSFLIVVLPAVPEERTFGHLDDGRAAGTAAVAHDTREAIRAELASRPDAWVVDAEQAIRAVGTARAHHAAMFKFAKIPYTEAVFGELGAQLAGVLRAVYGLTPRVVVVDQDSAAAFDEPVNRLRESGARVVVRTGTEEVAALAVAAGVPAESAVLLRLGTKPDAWPGELVRSGLLDRLPAPDVTVRRARRTTRETVSLDDFMAGLNVEVDLQPVGPDSATKVVEVVSRAKDFTLGTEKLDLAEDREVFAVRVSDKFGEYGICGAVGITAEGVVDVFSLSCVVLGKGVEDIVLQRLREEHGDIAFRHRRTPHNQITAGFLTDAGARIEEIP
jgi:predicted enzyme involved in methoxymalonyl-ACP biosynthesis